MSRRNRFRVFPIFYFLYENSMEKKRLTDLLFFTFDFYRLKVTATRHLRLTGIFLSCKT